MMAADQEACKICPLHKEIYADIKALKIMIDEKDKRDEVKHDALEQSIVLASQNMERRLMTLNELRNEVTQDRNMFLRREIFDLFIADTGKWRENVGARLTALETRSVVWGSALALGVTILTLALHFLVK